MAVLIGIIAFIIGYKVYSKIQRESRINQRFGNFSVPNFFTPHQSYVSADLSCAIAVDNDNRLICLQDQIGENRFYDERYVVGSQILVNEQTYQQKPFINIWSSYLIGKWIGGDKVGEIAAMTTNVRVKKQVDSIKLKVTVNDLRRPNYTIVFLDGQANKALQDLAFNEAEYWDSIIKVFIHTDNRNQIPFNN